MKNLRFQELLLLSLKAKKARNIKFHPKITILTGGNESGKSLLTKSIYYTFGCNPPSLTSTDKWPEIAPISFVSFKIGNNTYGILRDGLSSFGIFDSQDKLLHACYGTTREGGIAQRLANLLGFSLKLDNQKGVESLISPAHYFLPFYIDQDKGWTSSWAASFESLRMLPDFRDKLIEYHLGIKPEEYYTAKKTLEDLKVKIQRKNIEKDAITDTRESIQSTINDSSLQVDFKDFEQEIEEIQENVSKLSSSQQANREDVLKFESEKYTLLNEITLLNRTVAELEGDYKYISSNDAPIVECPTCGTEHINSLSSRYAILDDVQKCEELKNKITARLVVVNANIAQLTDKREEIYEQINTLEVRLAKNNHGKALGELIGAEAKKTVRHAFAESVNKLTDELIKFEQMQRKAQEEVDTWKDPKRAKEINSEYQKKMNLFLKQLNVLSIQENKYEKAINTIANKVSGSDAPRTVLAQYFAFISVMKTHSPTTTLCPLVIDTPLQQDQDKTNHSLIFKFIFNHQPTEEQLILATVSIDGNTPASTNDYKIVDNGNAKFSCLRSDEYISVAARLTPMHNELMETLAGIRSKIAEQPLEEVQPMTEEEPSEDLDIIQQ